MYDWLNTEGESRHVVGMNLGIAEEDDAGVSLKVSLDNATFDNGLLADTTRFNTQLQFSGLIETDEVTDALGDMVESLFSDMHIENTALEVLGLGAQIQGGQPRFQLSAMNFQFPLLRLETLQYTHGVGGSFLRPGVGFVLGSEYVWASPFMCTIGSIPKARVGTWWA